jgi:hypothetical protein
MLDVMRGIQRIHAFRFNRMHVGNGSRNVRLNGGIDIQPNFSQKTEQNRFLFLLSATLF